MKNPRFKLYKDFLPELGHEKALELACQIEKETPYRTYHKLYPLISLPTTKERKRSWYVNIYELYPIYEPAKGGYYYNGIKLTDSREFSTRKKAQRYLNQCAKEFKEDYTEDTDFETFISKNNTYMEHIGKKYIGQGHFIQLERYQGKSESGRVPYC